MASTPKLKTTRVPLDQLEYWPGNARRGIVAGIKESMMINGVFQPVGVQKSTNRIIYGNHRIMALRELHAEDPDRWPAEVDVILFDVNDTRAEKMNLADNKTSDDANWDDQALLDQLQAIVEDGDTLEGTGFALDDIDDLVAALEDAMPDDSEADGADGVDDAPPIPASPISKPGDLFTLGRNKVYCGDATDPGAYTALLGGGRSSKHDLD